MKHHCNNCGLYVKHYRDRVQSNSAAGIRVSHSACCTSRFIEFRIGKRYRPEEEHHCGRQ